jgi:hypothetical protein
VLAVLPCNLQATRKDAAGIPSPRTVYHNCSCSRSLDVSSQRFLPVTSAAGVLAGGAVMVAIGFSVHAYLTVKSEKRSA